MKIIKWPLIGLLAMLVVAALLSISALADPDGSEIQITDQPDRLILQLGPQWAGTEFELKTDAGIYPGTVVVDESGILRMDLGGSKTYILSCIAVNPATPAPRPTQSEETAAPQPTNDPPASADQPEVTASESGIPAGQLALFLGGLVVATGGLLTMRYFKRRHRTDGDYDDED
ncbi:MAG: hypothetical protein FWC62_04625 [Firmicutes bacterium]|nr:hypothetical protein [Bacillota bacterium]